MTPPMPKAHILQGDARQVLRGLPDASVQCVVTSPPYYKQRDYGVPGQIGHEQSPETYVAEMVAVFREISRVLRDDGCVFVNLGDSYASGDKRPTRSPSSARALACDSGDTRPPNWSGPGYAYPDLCDGCRAAWSTGSVGSTQPTPQSRPPGSTRGRDNARQGSAAASSSASLLDVQASTKPVSCSPPRASCSHCDNCGACLSVLRSSSRDARLCVRKTWLNYTTTPAKPKDLIGIPWMVAFALQADGWYLRSDIIWHKPAPMPESVRDRPTSAHEHVFLLSRSKCYVYDAEAIAEPLQGEPHSPGNLATGRLNGDNCVAQRERVWGERGWRNAGNVWSLPTENYRGAHFAVMPAALAERCIRAGSRPGDTVLDPFAGVFTTALVADRLGRSSIGIELNPDYCRIARERITRDAGMFASLTEQAPPIPPPPEPPLLAFLRDIAPALIE
jgi:DNA modification methylase